MFERYTESARKTLFFARYEASQTGSRAIETEHLLLGLLREVRGVVATILDEAHASADEMRGEIKRRVVFGERFPTSDEIPFSPATKRVLERAAEEADRLLHSYIGTEHLLLALIAENRDSIAAQVLETQGVRLAGARAIVLTSTRADATTGGETVTTSVVLDDARARIRNIKRLVVDLMRTSRDSPEAQLLAEKIDGELDELRAMLD
jgi:ATP-dependent Clp protease ATP-binding subunit ClpC